MWKRIVLGRTTSLGMAAGVMDEDLPRICAKVVSLYEPFPTVQPGDWQYEHQESGQTYTQYRKAVPLSPLVNGKCCTFRFLGK